MSKVLLGEIVVVGKSPRTVTVEVKTTHPHPLYKKLVKKNKKILADIQGIEVSLGDMVKIGETRPISKRKHFKVLEVKR